MLIIFDVDGTLISGEEIDWKCFEDAFASVAGFTLSQSFWANITEVTSAAIVHQALPGHSLEAHLEIEAAVRGKYLQKLRSAHSRDSNAFLPTSGVGLLLEYLENQPGVDIAIATGDWHETISFKLSAAGLNIFKYPMATSSDYSCRADIIELAARRSGRALSEVIYVGDGLWDFQACRKLGIPFLGVGRRRERLLEAGASHVLPDVHPDSFIPWFEQFRKGR